MQDLNKDWKKRDKHIFGNVSTNYHQHGGCRSFEALTLEQLQYLIDNNFIDLEDCQNSAPSVEEMFEFMKAHSDFVAHGYVVSPDRDDYRVSLEGLRYRGKKKVSVKLVAEFVSFCQGADALEVDEKQLFCWWD